MSEDPAEYQMTAPGRRSKKVDAPARDELERARELAAALASAIGRAKKFRMDRVSLDVDEAEELCQLLHDSLRTADQISSNNAKGSTVHG